MMKVSSYTTEVRFICESLYRLEHSTGYNDIEKILKAVHKKIFDFDYPIFDEKYRSVLEIKILRHFYTREIGFETVGLWKLKLADKMNTIMPYYNKWYASDLLEFNPLWDTDFTRKGNINDTNKSKNDSTANSTTTDNGKQTNSNASKTKSKFSDTPQGSISSLENDTYLTSATIDETNGSYTNTAENTNVNNSTNTINHEATNLNEYFEIVQGNRGVFDNGTMLTHYRATFTNIDKMLLNEMEDLFMLLW